MCQCIFSGCHQSFHWGCILISCNTSCCWQSWICRYWRYLDSLLYCCCQMPGRLTPSVVVPDVGDGFDICYWWLVILYPLVEVPAAGDVHYISCQILGSLIHLVKAPAVADLGFHLRSFMNVRCEYLTYLRKLTILSPQRLITSIWFIEVFLIVCGPKHDDHIGNTVRWHVCILCSVTMTTDGTSTSWSFQFHMLHNVCKLCM